MTETGTSRPIRIRTNGGPVPYIMVPVPLLDRVRALLIAGDVPHSVESGTVSLNGGPAIAVINLHRGADVGRAQAVLDQAG